MKSLVFTEDHDAFRRMVQRYFTDQVVPVFEEWEAVGHPPRDFYRDVAALGISSVQIPEEHGGGGMKTFTYNAVVTQEAARAGIGLGPLRSHMDIVLPYLLHYATDEQKARWLPGIASGDIVLSIAMTEPDTGSNLSGIATTAVRKGDHYLLNGAKTFITGGINADLVLVVARTDREQAGTREGLSILVVDTASEGFHVGRNLPKLGLKAQDTVELSFGDVRVPVADRLGVEGHAFDYLTRNLAQERLTISVAAAASAAAALATTVGYVSQREVFFQPLASFQNTKFVLADCATEVTAAETFVDHALLSHDAGQLSVAEAAQLKLFTTEVQGRVVDKCLQLHGGYGYVTESRIARMYADARVTRIFGGTSEVMRTIIAKDLGLPTGRSG